MLLGLVAGEARQGAGEHPGLAFQGALVGATGGRFFRQRVGVGLGVL